MDKPYTEAQLARYLDLIDLPHDPFLGGIHPLPKNIKTLTALHVHHISSIPYENLLLHYPAPASASPTQDSGPLAIADPLACHVSLDPQQLYQKIVEDRKGRGGFCFENTTFFRSVLRSLGFQVYTAGARIRRRVGPLPVGGYIGWQHAVNIVTLADGSKYMVDVSFGGDGPTAPLPLLEGVVHQNIGTQQLRLIKDHLPEQIDTESPQKVWIYQYRNSSDQEFSSYYSFSEIESLPIDLEMANFYVTKHPQSFQRFTMLAVKFLRTKEGDEVESTIYGKVMLVDAQVKSNLGGKTTLVQTCATDEERVEALNTHFGILITPSEAKGIEGRPTQLGRLLN